MKQGLELNAGMRGGAGYLLELECVRGLAILLVFLFHALGVSVGQIDAPVPFWLSYIAAGSSGVTLFFVLSGFLLSLPWLRYASGEGHLPGVRNYYVARVLRIVPLYLVAVLFASVVTGNWAVGLRAALFQFVGFDIFPYSVVWWTLTTEVQFYLVLPLLALALLRPGWTRWVCVFAGVAWLGAYSYTFVYPGGDQPIRSYWLTKSLFGRLPAFLIGVLAAWCYLRCRGLGWERQRLAATLIIIGAWLCLGWVLQLSLELGKRSEWSWHLHHSYEALLWAIIVLALLLGAPFARRVLVNRSLAILGKLSYSLYLVHVPILFYLIYPVKQTAGDAYAGSVVSYLLPLAALILSLGLSFITYRLIELPFLNLKHRIPL
ncbi:acyltransferase [Halioglobus maricola]|uniref:Acyltransferase n=1 Tax=Halioglobus maricola TaxID=2601894 RepID=A0A5P9NGV6_9GAMM|nr:acyltransferase [Halioglobus maricola]QFU74769.1 acyltransferase [Halioglobus maricola]